MLRDVRLSIERDHTHIGLCSVVTYRVTQYVTVTSSSLANVLLLYISRELFDVKH